MGFWKYVRRWFKRSPKNKKSFSPVVPSIRLSEFRGTLPRFTATGATHHLFCQRITKAIAQALLAQGFRGAGIGSPTHVIFCTVRLGRDKNATRCLFNVYLALAALENRSLEDWVAAKVTSDLKHTLVTRRDSWFLVRCRSDREFPWCLEPEELDDFWLTEAAVYYRFYLKRVSSIASFSLEEEEPTELQ